MNFITRTLELSGSNAAIGKQLVESGDGQLASYMKTDRELNKADMDIIISLFERWCPGLNDELQGFADAACIPAASVAYYAVTYLRPSCSQIAISAQKSANGHPILAHSYEYNHQHEAFTLARTSVDGKYTYIGTCG